MPNPVITWKTIAGRECLHFLFNGKLAAEDTRIAAEKWKAEFKPRAGKKITLVWDCLALGGYDHDSRVLWQSTLGELRGQIEGIWLVTRSLIITVGANVISTFTKFKITIVASEEEIKF